MTATIKSTETGFVTLSNGYSKRAASRVTYLDGTVKVFVRTSGVNTGRRLDTSSKREATAKQAVTFEAR
jgi:hypothetical protein